MQVRPFVVQFTLIVLAVMCVQEVRTGPILVPTTDLSEELNSVDVGNSQGGGVQENGTTDKSVNSWRPCPEYGTFFGDLLKGDFGCCLDENTCSFQETGTGSNHIHIPGFLRTRAKRSAQADEMSVSASSNSKRLLRDIFPVSASATDNTKDFTEITFCESKRELIKPIFGTLADESGRRVSIYQFPPFMTQMVVIDRCEKKPTLLIHGECRQKYEPQEMYIVSPNSTSNHAAERVFLSVPMGCKIFVDTTQLLSVVTLMGKPSDRKILVRTVGGTQVAHPEYTFQSQSAARINTFMNDQASKSERKSVEQKGGLDVQDMSIADISGHPSPDLKFSKREDVDDLENIISEGGFEKEWHRPEVNNESGQQTYNPDGSNERRNISTIRAGSNGGKNNSVINGADIVAINPTRARGETNTSINGTSTSTMASTTSTAITIIPDEGGTRKARTQSSTTFEPTLNSVNVTSTSTHTTTKKSTTAKARTTKASVVRLRSTLQPEFNPFPNQIKMPIYIRATAFDPVKVAELTKLGVNSPKIK